MLNFSKILRELRRIPDQIAHLPTNLSSYLFGAYYYDTFLANECLQIDGMLPETNRMAIFVIYPKSGLQASHLQTLNYFTKSGYATLVISNNPMSTIDKERVLQHCWRYIERPNYGYDFGAYREGILNIGIKLTELKNLILINDSTWFPLPDSKNWLEEASKLNVDFVGAASHYGLVRADPRYIKSTPWKHSSNHRSFHYSSFALSISESILSDSSFFQFWKKYPLSNKKRVTVRRGETGLTKWIISKGYSHDSVLDFSKIEAELKSIERVRLLEIASNLILLDNPMVKSVKKEMLSNQESCSHQDLIDLILFATAYQGASYALSDYLINNYNYPFFKKSPLSMGGEAANIALSLTAKLSGNIGEEISNEAKAQYLSELNSP